jgi:hypothetical protein
MGDVYMGIENVLKRVLKFRGEERPSEKRWHVELLEQFCEPADSSLPVFFQDCWIERIDSFRRLQHVTHHGYAPTSNGTAWGRDCKKRVRSSITSATGVEQFLAGLDEEVADGGAS